MAESIDDERDKIEDALSSSVEHSEIIAEESEDAVLTAWLAENFVFSFDFVFEAISDVTNLSSLSASTGEGPSEPEVR